MSSEKTSPFLVDAVKASASRFKETKNALEARAGLGANPERTGEGDQGERGSGEAARPRTVQSLEGLRGEDPVPHGAGGAVRPAGAGPRRHDRTARRDGARRRGPGQEAREARRGADQAAERTAPCARGPGAGDAEDQRGDVRPPEGVGRPTRILRRIAGDVPPGADPARFRAGTARREGEEPRRGREIPGRRPRGERHGNRYAAGDRGEGSAPAADDRAAGPEASDRRADASEPCRGILPRRDLRRGAQRVPPEGVPSGRPGADDPRPRDREEGPRPGAERERDPQGAEAGARRLRERRLRHGFEARRGDPQGARGDSPDSLDPSGDPPFAIAWIGIAYTGTPGTRGSCI